MAAPPAQEGNVGLAFGMVCAAGACTSLGAGMAFCVNLEVSCLPRALHAGCPCSAPLRILVLRCRSFVPASAPGRGQRAAVGRARWCAVGGCMARVTLELRALALCAEQALSGGVAGAFVRCHVLHFDDRDLRKVARGLQVRAALTS